MTLFFSDDLSVYDFLGRQLVKAHIHAPEVLVKERVVAVNEMPEKLLRRQLLC